MHALRRKNVFTTCIIIINVEITNTGQFNKVLTQYLSSESKILTYFLQFHFIVVLLLFFFLVIHTINVIYVSGIRQQARSILALSLLYLSRTWWHLTFRSLSNTRSKQKSRVSAALKKVVYTVYNNVILHYKQVDIRLLSNFNFKTL